VSTFRRESSEHGRIPPSILAIVVVVLLGMATFGHLIEPWLAGLAGHVMTVGK